MRFLNPLEASDHPDSEHWEDNAIMVAGTSAMDDWGLAVSFRSG